MSDPYPTTILFPNAAHAATSHLLTIFAFALSAFAQDKKKEEKFLDPIDTKVPHISTDKTIKYDYDIVYVRAKRAGDKVHKRFFTDFSSPVTIEPGADLMLLHPDGKEELLVAGGDGSVTDPMISFDAQWCYYVLLHNMVKASQWNPPKQGADIYKIHLKTRKIVKLTNQKFSPNTGAAYWSKDYRTPEPGKSHFEYGVYNMGPCPLPGGRIVFTSNRDGFRPAKGYPVIALQLFTMDDRDTDIGDDDTPTNLDKIGHLNLAGALHPVVLRDGRIMYSTLESQGARSDILWASGPSTRTEPAGTRSSAPSTPAGRPTASTSRRNSPTVRSWWRNTTTRTTAASARTSRCSWLPWAVDIRSAQAGVRVVPRVSARRT